MGRHELQADRRSAGEARGGYVASPLMGQAMKEARKRGVPIEEHQVGWG
jgi:hypothetical protein